MKFLLNRGNRHPCYEMKFLILELGYTWLGCWPKGGSMGIPKQPRLLPRVFSPQTDSKTPLLKIILTQLIKHGEVKLVPL